MITKVKIILTEFLCQDLVNIVLDYDERFNFDLQEYKAKIKKCTTEKRWLANESYQILRECFTHNNNISYTSYITSFYEVETIEAFWISDTLYVPRHYKYFNYLTNEVFMGRIENYNLIPVEKLIVR